MTHSPFKVPHSVLVVDDDVLLRMFAVDVLRDEGYTVLEAGTANEALKVMSGASAVNILFTDVQMPGGMDGFALIRLVHILWPYTSVLLTSGGLVPSSDDLQESDRFIGKPYRPVDLVAEIRGAVFRMPN
jgi:CheY-like chemotaxis protein